MAGTGEPTRAEGAPRNDGGMTGLLRWALPTPTEGLALAGGLVVAAFVMLLQGPTTSWSPRGWLFGIGIVLLPMSGLMWVLGHVVSWVHRRRHRGAADTTDTVGVALRWGALWSFWMSWLLQAVFQTRSSLTSGALTHPVVRVGIVLLVLVGVLGLGWRREEADRLSRGRGHAHGTLGRVVFIVSSVCLGLLTAGIVFAWGMALGGTAVSMGSL